MADTGRTGTRRRNTASSARNRNVYIEGNAVRKLQEVPARRPEHSQQSAQKKRVSTAKASAQSQQLSRQAQRNREKAMGMNLAFVLFLAVVSVAVLMSCINFLQLRAQVTTSMKAKATLEAELTQLREDNDAYYSQVNSDVDLSRIRQIAYARLGMQHPSDDQILTYKTTRSSYVRQYQELPDSR